VVVIAALAVVLAGCKVEESVGPVGSPTPAPADPAPGNPALPSSMAALGDSITAGFASCLTLAGCPRNSWSTGDGFAVDSHYKRILAGNPAIKGQASNYAKPRARASDLPSQVDQAVAVKPAYLTVMVGANDACRAGVQDMTSAATFAAEIGAALATLKAASPRSRILMASIPDVYRVWEVGHTSKVATSVWSLGVCPSLLANPTSTAPADVARRQLFRDRVDEYNQALARACARYGPRCKWDGGAVHRVAFDLNRLSVVDFFHPNSSGQNEIARLTYPGAFTW
jgi:lysophospholipase L1-like esterase